MTPRIEMRPYIIAMTRLLCIILIIIEFIAGCNTQINYDEIISKRELICRTKLNSIVKLSDIVDVPFDAACILDGYQDRTRAVNPEMAIVDTIQKPLHPDKDVSTTNKKNIHTINRFLDKIRYTASDLDRSIVFVTSDGVHITHFKASPDLDIWPEFQTRRNQTILPKNFEPCDYVSAKYASIVRIKKIVNTEYYSDRETNIIILGKYSNTFATGNILNQVGGSLITSKEIAHNLIPGKAIRFSEFSKKRFLRVYALYRDRLEGSSAEISKINNYLSRYNYISKKYKRAFVFVTNNGIHVSQFSENERLELEIGNRIKTTNGFSFPDFQPADCVPFEKAALLKFSPNRLVLGGVK